MTQTQFYILLGCYGAVVFWGSIVNKIKPAKVTFFTKSRVRIVWIALAGIMVLGSGIAGYVGMILSWRAAPWIFAFGVFGKILGSLFIRSDQDDRSGLGFMLSEGELFLDGVILTCVFFGPARHLFL
jgi:hypothetical protein